MQHIYGIPGWTRAQKNRADSHGHGYPKINMGDTSVLALRPIIFEQWKPETVQTVPEEGKNQEKQSQILYIIVAVSSV